MNDPTRRDFAKSLAALVCIPYAKHLNDEERKTVEKNIENASEPLERLRAFPLTNADEPDFGNDEG